jgi:hypothetical protein
MPIQNDLKYEWPSSKLSFIVCSKFCANLLGFFFTKLTGFFFFLLGLLPLFLFFKYSFNNKSLPIRNASDGYSTSAIILK